MPILYIPYRQKRGFLTLKQPQSGYNRDKAPETVRRMVRHALTPARGAHGHATFFGTSGGRVVSGMRKLRVRLMVVHWIPVLLVEFVWVAKNESSPVATGEPKDVKLK
jgi:hypothetical protein